MIRQNQIWEDEDMTQNDEHQPVPGRRAVLKALTLAPAAVAGASAGLFGSIDVRTGRPMLARAEAQAGERVKMAFIQWMPHTVPNAWCCQTNANQSPQGQQTCPLCRAKAAPLDGNGGTVVLEEGSAGEAGVRVEEVVDRGADGGELLKRAHAPETEHRSLPPSEWTM